uniref:Uncharacterized protein n=1 Tax=Cacopsylla melanoneura TaxID=428564 RepID=A0A8D8YB61_9HEMI
MEPMMIDDYNKDYYKALVSYLACTYNSVYKPDSFSLPREALVKEDRWDSNARAGLTGFLLLYPNNILIIHSDSKFVFALLKMWLTLVCVVRGELLYVCFL